MAKRKIRELTEAEQVARKKYGGLTRREFNATKGRFAKLKESQEAQHTSGTYDVVAFFESKMDKPDVAPATSIPAAIDSYRKLMTHPHLRALRLVEHVPQVNDAGEYVGTKPITRHSFIRPDYQRYVNSRSETLWRRKDRPEVYSSEALKKNPSLMGAAEKGELVFYKKAYYDGSPWWDTYR